MFFCGYCGNKSEEWCLYDDDVRFKEKQTCQDCHPFTGPGFYGDDLSETGANIPKHLWRVDPLKRFCTQCGSQLPPLKNKKDGSPRPTNQKTCHDCSIAGRGTRPMRQLPEDVKASIRNKVEDKQTRFMRRKSVSEEDKRKEHTARVIEWQRKNPEKHRASQQVHYYKEALNVLYECPCDIPSNKKHFHHPDYKKPLDVLLLCSSCHRKEHVRLKKQAAQEHQRQ